MADNQDNPGIRVPPPLIYLLPLASGLVLDKRLHVPFLPRTVTRPWDGHSSVAAGWWVDGLCEPSRRPARPSAPTGPYRAWSQTDPSATPATRDTWDWRCSTLG